MGGNAWFNCQQNPGDGEGSGGVEQKKTNVNPQKPTVAGKCADYLSLKFPGHTSFSTSTHTPQWSKTLPCFFSVLQHSGFEVRQSTSSRLTRDIKKESSKLEYSRVRDTTLMQLDSFFWLDPPRLVNSTTFKLVCNATINISPSRDQDS